MSLIISSLFLFLSSAMFITLMIVFILDKKKIPGEACDVDGECPVGSECRANICQQTECKSDSDCDDSALCFDGYCYPQMCNIGNDCPDGLACSSGFCVTVGGDCTSNNDCRGLSCISNVCGQCTIDGDCPSGQACFSSICRYPTEGETKTGQTFYDSEAQGRGNLAAPPGYFCNSSLCGTSPTGCDTNSPCSGSCPYCVEGVCRCAKGAIYEGCVTSIDCSSGVCGNSSFGPICYPSGGECVFSYGTEGVSGDGICTEDMPYCAEGKCSRVSEGTLCGGPMLPEDMCSNPISLGVGGSTGVNPDGMGVYCVQGICSTVPGFLNQICVADDSCGFLGTEGGQTVFNCGSNGRCGKS